MYKTIEAVVENKKVIFLDDFQVPKTTTKVLITFLNEEEDNNTNIETLIWSEEVLWTKDHNDFIEILKSA